MRIDGSRINSGVVRTGSDASRTHASVRALLSLFVITWLACLPAIVMIVWQAAL